MECMRNIDVSIGNINGDDVEMVVMRDGGGGSSGGVG